ncbi:MAG: J domain-containing protein [Anaerolineales bacterium]
MSHYDILGVPPEASDAQVRAAYRTLVQLFHPDRLGHLKEESRTFAEDRLKALNAAYEVLGDPAKRARYDASLAVPPPPRASAPYRPPQQQPSPPAPPPSQPAYSAQNPYSSSQAFEAAPRGPAAQSDWATFKRQAVLENRRRLAQLDAEIAELARGVKQLEADRSRAQRQLSQQEMWTRRNFWMSTALTGALSLAILFIGIGIFSQPPGVLNPTAQRLALVLLSALYEYVAALTIVLACRFNKAPLAFWGTLLYSLRGLFFGWLAGLIAWAVWAAIFIDLSSLAALIGLGVVALIAHGVFDLAALGHLPRFVHEQQRLFEHSYTPMLQAYQHQLSQLRARKAVIESETT